MLNTGEVAPEISLHVELFVLDCHWILPECPDNENVVEDPVHIGLDPVTAIVPAKGPCTEKTPETALVAAGVHDPLTIQ